MRVWSLCALASFFSLLCGLLIKAVPDLFHMESDGVVFEVADSFVGGKLDGNVGRRVVVDDDLELDDSFFV